MWCILAVFAVDPKLTLWLPVYTKKLSYSRRNRRKGYYTDGAPSAKWLWSLMIMHINGHPRGRGEGGQFSLGTYVGMVPWICWHLLSIFSPGWRIGMLLQFYSRIPEEKTPGICYIPSRNGWEREQWGKYRECCPIQLLDCNESSTYPHAVDKCTKAEARRWTFLETNQIVICVDLDWVWQLGQLQN